MNDDRLIYANALMKNIGKIPQLRGITYGRMKKAVEETPTIDAVSVVHGRWVKDTYNGRTCCSACKVDLPGVWYYNGEDQDENYEEIDSTPYCPNCGAKMDLKEATNATVDAVHVVHGRWVFDPGVDYCYKCSECKQEAQYCHGSGIEQVLTNFCPNCGAKMDLKEATNEENPDPVCTEV